MYRFSREVGVGLPYADPEIENVKIGWKDDNADKCVVAMAVVPGRKALFSV